MITIISGLPRSGTSLTMQMLKAAGYPIFWNREPNFGPANPRGYYEWTGAKDLHVDTEPKLSLVEDRFVKIFPHHFPCLTDKHLYRFIYLDRKIEDVQRSQSRMLLLEGRDREARDVAGDEYAAQLERLRFTASIYLRAFPSVTVQFSDMFTGKGGFQILDFLKGAASQYVAMEKCVDSSLRHW